MKDRHKTNIATSRNPFAKAQSNQDFLWTKPDLQKGVTTFCI